MKTFTQFIQEVVTWTKPTLRDESGELHRVSQDMGIDHSKLKAAFKSGQRVPLDHKVWSNMQNTDSWDTNTPAKVHKLARQYGRDSKSIGNVFKKGGTLPAPTVLFHKGRHHLVGGNTRLMMARAHGVTPHAHMIHIPEEVSTRDMKKRDQVNSSITIVGEQFR